ncbi:hypothetical protein TorRG33x02_245890 [Trema orientale]|uniref:Uncharacterized protein n=1 Tax=Trema orientale TaxID=63057 RepID=A0A2P5DP14_TREOI|nr:hypothetical protein TorRG33x02_245890 [Trema orientale]
MEDIVDCWQSFSLADEKEVFGVDDELFPQSGEDSPSLNFKFLMPSKFKSGSPAITESSKGKNKVESTTSFKTDGIKVGPIEVNYLANHNLTPIQLALKANTNLKVPVVSAGVSASTTTNPKMPVASARVNVSTATHPKLLVSSVGVGASTTTDPKVPV